MFPGGMEVGQEELAALARVIESKNLFRYYGVGDGPDEVASFEREFADQMERSTPSASTRVPRHSSAR